MPSVDSKPTKGTETSSATAGKTSSETPKGDENPQPPPSNIPESSKDSGVPSKSKENSQSPPTNSSGSKKEGGATETVEKDVVNAFKQFTAVEKMRVQEHQRSMARRDKAVKLNDLKKFAENFKLTTQVPLDLVPILAKDKRKQQEIVDKAKKQAVDGPPTKSTPPRPAASTPSAATPTEQKSAKAGTARNDAGHTSPLAPTERQTQQRSRPQQPNFNSMSLRGGNAQMRDGIPPQHRHGHLGQRLDITRGQHRQGVAMQHSIPIPDPRSPPAGPAATSPGGSTHWNVKANNFTPNVAAQVFVPTASNPSTGSSPVRGELPNRPQERKAPSPGNFFDHGRKPITPAADRPSIGADFNPIPRLIQEAKDQGKDFGSNGGVPPAFRTAPTWDVAEANKDKTFADMFQKAPMNMPSVSPHNQNMTQQAMPYQHQLPFHPQQPTQMPHGHTPQQTPRHHPVQPHHGGPGTPHHYDDHRMQFSQSTSSVHPSPRAAPPFMYNGQQGQVPPGPQFYQQAMPGYGPQGGHPMAYRQVSNGPQFMPPAMTGHAMAGQPAGVPYMMGPQMVYSPVPAQAYPQHGNAMQPQPGPGGFPSSPRPPAQLMSHQGSQHGHPQQGVVYIQQPGPHGPVMYAQQGPS